MSIRSLGVVKEQQVALVWVWHSAPNMAMMGEDKERELLYMSVPLIHPTIKTLRYYSLQSGGLVVCLFDTKYGPKGP